MNPYTQMTMPMTQPFRRFAGTRRLAVVALFAIQVGYMPAQLTLSLTPSQHNDYNVSCFGAKDGSIDLSVTGGTAPYVYSWSTGSTTQDLFNLPAGFYSVTVTDATMIQKRTEITLTEPNNLKAEAIPYEYITGYNISLFNAFNGSINLTVYDGVPPYTYAWSDGPTTEDRSALGSDNYSVTITDANGCIYRTDPVYLRQPERSDWTMSGNSNANPTTHFIGTNDNNDLVFKSAGAERLRLAANGGIKLSGLSPGFLKLGTNGLLATENAFPVVPCSEDIFPFWRTGGNNLTSCDPTRAVLGSTDARHVNFITNNDVRMRLTSGGQAQFGGDLETWPETDAAARVNILQGHGNWLALKTFPNIPGGPSGLWGLHNPPEQDRLVFMWHGAGDTPNYNTLTLHSDGRLISNDLTVYPNGKVRIGDVSTDTDYDFRLYVGGGILTERVKVAISSEEDWSDYVFSKDYRLLPLPELRAYIEQNHHLPDMKSAADMVRGGLDVSDITARLLARIEELNLYILQLEDRLSRIERNSNKKE